MRQIKPVVNKQPHMLEKYLEMEAKAKAFNPDFDVATIMEPTDALVYRAVKSASEWPFIEDIIQPSMLRDFMERNGLSRNQRAISQSFHRLGYPLAHKFSLRGEMITAFSVRNHELYWDINLVCGTITRQLANEPPM